MKITFAALLLLLSVNAQAKDYGIGHTIPIVIAAKVLPEINGALFKESPKVAKLITQVELGIMAALWCRREARARGTWHISEWDDITGSYDSTMDCLLPAGAAGFTIYNDGFSFDIISIKW